MTATDPQAVVLDLLAANQISPEIADQLLQPPAPAALPVVAVCGAALRVPGADTLSEFWEILQEAQPQTSRFSQQRLNLVLQATPELQAKYRHLPAELDSDSRALGNWLKDLDRFAPESFGLRDFDAMHLGPNERLVLMLAREALVAACMRPDELAGTSTGVFLAHNPDAAFPYVRLFEDPDERALLSGIPANVAYRVAYTYDLRGPVMNIDTTCSASLTAIHVARRALQLGECDTAIVGGVSLDLLPFQYHDSTSFVVSPRHLCNAYDAAADGTIWGEGAGMLVLRRLDDARADGNPVMATIEGSAVTSDGTSNGLAAPNPGAHTLTVRTALDEAGISGADLGYIEGHGAGTVLGDQVEISALTEALGEKAVSCSLGSCKTVTGHLKDAAGVVGFISALLRVSRGELPPLASLDNANTTIDWERSPLTLDRTCRAWESEGPRYAGVSSLGLSGTNAHAIIKQPDPAAADHALGTVAPVLLGAPTRESLWKLINQLADYLPSGATVSSIAATFARREAGPARIAVVADDVDSLQIKLGRLAAIRAFERAPESFAEQGILLGDTPAAAAKSREALPYCQHPATDLIDAFLAGEDVSSEYRALTDHIAPVSLPVAPLSTRRVWPKATGGEADVSDLFFDVQWDPAPLPDGVEPLGVVVVVAHSDTEAQAFRYAAAPHAQRIITVTGDVNADPSTDDHTGPLDEPGTYQKVWRVLGPDISELTDIVFLVPTPERAESTSLRDLVDGQRNGVVALFALVKSLLDAPAHHGVTLAVAALDAQPVGTPTDYHDPTRATPFGLLRVASQEMPHLLELCIDHQELDSSAAAELIVKELQTPRSNRARQVAWRDGQRLVRTIHRQPAATAADGVLHLPSGGCYVIAGGTGVLGAELTRILAERGASKVFVLSRTGMPDPAATDHDDDVRERLAAFDAAIGLGCEVVSLTCDITQPDAVAAAFESIDAQSGRIDGGYMLTKQLFHRWLNELDLEDFVTGIDNRVVGTWLLAEALRERGAGHLVLFSSISSMSGTKGAAECAAVNQYLDAAAPFLTAQGLPTFTLNLPLILRDRSDFNAATPIPPIDMGQFRGVISRFLDAPHLLDVVARVDWKEALYLKPVLRIPFSDELWSHAEQQARPTDRVSAPEGREEPGDAREALTRAWIKSLGSSPTDGSHFFDEGGSSLSVIAFVRNLNKELGQQVLEVADVYATPLFGALVERVDRASLSDESDALPEGDDIFAMVEAGELSPEQAAAMLGGSTP